MSIEEYLKKCGLYYVFQALANERGVTLQTFTREFAERIILLCADEAAS